MLGPSGGGWGSISAVALHQRNAVTRTRGGKRNHPPRGRRDGPVTPRRFPRSDTDRAFAVPRSPAVAPGPVGVVALVLAVTCGSWAEVVDRIAAIVGTEAVTVSEIDGQLRIAAMLNRSAVPEGAEARREALDQLVDRRLILADPSAAPFLVDESRGVETQMREFRHQTFLGGRDFEAALAHYGLTEGELRDFVNESLVFEGYVFFRFRSGQAVSASDLEAYYREVYAPLRQAAGRPVEPLEEVAGTISETLLEARANRMLEERLEQLRSIRRVAVLSTSVEGERP